MEQNQCQYIIQDLAKKKTMRNEKSKIDHAKENFDTDSAPYSTLNDIHYL